MLEKTIKEKYLQIVDYLQRKYSFDSNSLIPRSQLFHKYTTDRLSYNMPKVSNHIMGFIVRFAFSRNSGIRTQRKNENGKRVDCYFLKKNRKFFFNIFL
jgi:hypothetical protein